MKTWSFASLERIVQDARYAIRTLRRSPGFTAIACATLALGIGATTAIFTIVDSVLLRSLPFPEPERLVMVWERQPKSDRRNVVSMSNYAAWQERNRAFDAIAAFVRVPMNVMGGVEPIQVSGAGVTADFFRVLGVPPLLGRTFVTGEDAPGAAPVVVLTHGFWQRHFGSRPDVLGQRLSVDVKHHTIIGVMPADFRFPDPAVEVFVPLPVRREDGRNYSVVARLRPTTNVAAAQSEMSGIAVETARERPQANSGWGATVVPLHQQTVGPVERVLVVLFAAVAFLLLIACANVANLVLMRSAGRAREMRIRLALGAARGRLLHQMLVESVLLAGLGGILGMGLAWLSVEAMVRLLPPTFRMPRVEEISINPQVLLFTAAVTLGAAILFGLAPALRSRDMDHIRGLHDSSRSVASSHRRMRGVMVTAEVALALPLLVGAGLLAHSFMKLMRVEPGFRAEGLLTVRMRLLPVRERALHAEVVELILDRVRALPGVTAAGSIGRLPMDGGNSGSWYYRADRPEPLPAERPGGDVSIITPGYFQAMDIHVVRGRDFDSRDRIGSPHVGILNLAAARALFGDEEPLGKRLRVWWNDAADVEIVGITADIRHSQLRYTPYPCLFMPNAQQPFPFASLVIRTIGNPRGIGDAVKEQVRQVDPDQGVAQVETMERLVSDSIAQSKAQTVLLGVFAALALSLACIGIYGVLAYSVAQRKREIGVRLALGASPARAFRLILGEGLGLTATGMVIGVALSVALTRFLKDLLYEVEPLDPAVVSVVVTVLTLVAATACAVPALRATRVDPAVVLRDE
jgi:putative ABC transport system permease protein